MSLFADTAFAMPRGNILVCSFPDEYEPSEGNQSSCRVSYFQFCSIYSIPTQGSDRYLFLYVFVLDPNIVYNNGTFGIPGIHTYSQLSANGHSRKQTALLSDTFLNSRFYLPVKLCVYAFP